MKILQAKAQHKIRDDKEQKCRQLVPSHGGVEHTVKGFWGYLEPAAVNAVDKLAAAHKKEKSQRQKQQIENRPPAKERAEHFQSHNSILLFSSLYQLINRFAPKNTSFPFFPETLSNDTRRYTSLRKVSLASAANTGLAASTLRNNTRKGSKNGL